MTEEEAKAKWCPFGRVQVYSGSELSAVGVNEPRIHGGPESCRCIGSACMAWRWTGTHMPNPDDNGNLTKWDTSTYGFCGLAGKP